MEFLKKVENKVRSLVGGALMLVGGFGFVTGLCVLPANMVAPAIETIKDHCGNVPEEPMTEESSEEEEIKE